MTAKAGIETLRAPSDPQWIKDLTPEEFAEYEIVREEDIAENTTWAAELIHQHLGSNLPEEAVTSLAGVIVARLGRIHEGAIQVGKDSRQPEIDRLASRVHPLGYRLANPG